MAHKALIGGTAYEISGGKTLVGGTAYKIDKGKTLVGGTAYTIAFSVGIPVTITGSGNSSYSYAQINGTKYTSATNLVVEAGTVISFYAGGSSSFSAAQAKITLNGSSVNSSGSSTGAKSYDLTVTGYNSVSIALTYSGNKGTITITTT